MKTILQSGLTQKTISSSELNPLVAVADNHLLVNTRPSKFGVFENTGGTLPSISAHKFRITNSSANAVSVSQKTPLLLRTFDNTIDVNVDSNTIALQAVESYTPNGESRVLRLNHVGDSAAYEDIALTESAFGIQYYFKINSIGWTNADQPDYAIKPFGVYTNKEAIDGNLPAVALGVGKDLSENLEFRLFHGVVEDKSLPTASLNRWYRVSVEATESSSEFAITLSIENPTGSGQWSNVYTGTVVSTGAGMLDEIFTQNSFVVGISSDGVSEQEVESLFVYKDLDGQEDLLPSTTKEYFCVHNLDEYSVTGAVTGYYTS